MESIKSVKKKLKRGVNTKLLIKIKVAEFTEHCICRSNVLISDVNNIKTMTADNESTKDISSQFKGVNFE